MNKKERAMLKSLLPILQKYRALYYERDREIKKEIKLLNSEAKAVIKIRKEIRKAIKHIEETLK